jgi:alkylated DNA repair protein alkB homolog 8
VVSLLADTVMLFKNIELDTHKWVIIPRRSLVILTKESRYIYMHCIWRRKFDKINGVLCKREKRISLTFRKVLTGGCNCKYKEYCDTYLNKKDLN